MKRYRLENREKNFFGFESELIRSEHSGFLFEVGKNLFQLSFNPYVKPKESIYYVIDDSLVPTDFYIPYQLDACLVSNEIISDAISTTGDYGKRFYYVNGITHFCKLPKPHIDNKDLISIISSGWNRAEEDYLGISMTLMLLSSPKVFSTTGGLGGESYFLSKGHTSIALKNHLEKTLFFNLPSEMKRSNPFISYHLVETDVGLKSVVTKIHDKTIREVTYNSTIPMDYFPLVYENRTPTVPLSIREASPHRNPHPDMYVDAIEWILHAQLIRPNDLDSVIKKSKKLAIEYGTEFKDTLGQLGYTFNEINTSQAILSLSRLHLSPEFDSSMIREYDELLHFTSDNIKPILQELEGEDRLKKNPYLRYPEEFRLVVGSVYKLWQMKQKGVDIKDVEDDIGYLVDNKKIKKSLDVAREDGYIYSLENYIDMKPVYITNDLLK